MTIKEEKEAFLQMNDINALVAATRRNEIYIPCKKTRQNIQKLHRTLDECTDGIVNESNYKNGGVSERKHCANIERLSCVVTAECGDFLDGNRLRIGTAHKFLNVWLKKLWCKGEIETPLHCPFDKGVIYAVRARVFPDVCCNWTQSDDIADYKGWVKAFHNNREDLCKEFGLRSKNATMAVWELYHWNRR